MHRGSLYALLLPFMHTRLQIPSDDTDFERLLQQSARDRIGGVVIQGGQSRTLLLADLGSELGELRCNLNKRLQGKFPYTMNSSYPDTYFIVYLYIV